MRIVVIGAIDEAIDLVRDLINRGHEVVVLDDDSSRIDRFVQELDVATYLFSLFDLATFMRAGMHKADIVLAIHPTDTVNVLVCIYARSLGIPKIYAIVSSTHTANVLSKLGFVEGVLVKATPVKRAITELIYGVKIMDLDEESCLVMLKVGDEFRLEGEKVRDLEERGLKVMAILDGENNSVDYDPNYVLKKGEKIIARVGKDEIESLLFKYKYR